MVYGLGKTANGKASMEHEIAQIFYIKSYETFRTELKGE
jgi:hypothetical protein